MQRNPVNSSQMVSVGYDATTQVLEIEFRGGSVYQYDGVPEGINCQFLAAPSLGKYFGANIKDAFATFKIIDGKRVALSQAKASAASIDLLRRLAKQHGLWSGTSGEYIGPMWRDVIKASGTSYEAAVRGTVEEWLSTLLQAQCSAAIELLKARG